MSVPICAIEMPVKQKPSRDMNKIADIVKGQSVATNRWEVRTPYGEIDTDKILGVRDSDLLTRKQIREKIKELEKNGAMAYQKLMDTPEMQRLAIVKDSSNNPYLVLIDRITVNLYPPIKVIYLTGEGKVGRREAMRVEDFVETPKLRSVARFLKRSGEGTD